MQLETTERAIWSRLCHLSLKIWDSLDIFWANLELGARSCPSPRVHSTLYHVCCNCLSAFSLLQYQLFVNAKRPVDVVGTCCWDRTARSRRCTDYGTSLSQATSYVEGISEPILYNGYLYQTCNRQGASSILTRHLQVHCKQPWIPTECSSQLSLLFLAWREMSSKLPSVG